MSQTIPVDHVKDVSESTTLTVRGKLLMDDFKCWVVPGTATRSMDAVCSGLRILLPRLGSEVKESPLALLITNGRPMASIERVEVTGRVRPDDSGKCIGLMDEVSSVTFVSNDESQHIDLDRITQISDWHMEGISQIDDPQFREALRQRYQSERQKY
ncbi:MAG: hypothetical protein R3C10_07050 [Pirellulales bacterium]